MDHWYHTPPSLKSGEYILSTEQEIRLYDGDKKTSFNNGYITLTNLRLLWTLTSQSSNVGLDLEHVVLVEEESGGFTSSPKLVLHLSQLEPGQITTPVASSDNTYTKLCFKQGGISSFFLDLQNAIAKRCWEKIPSAEIRGNSGGRPKIRAGILGIERAIQAKQDQTNTNINVAFEDLKNLMGFAKEMVTISKNIANKIKEQTGEVSSDETTQFRSYLLSLGIDDPVTKDTVGSSTEYHRRLAHEICSALKTPIQEAGGVMILTEVYCRINRARGLELLSSEDVYNGCCAMASENLPLKLHKFESGVQVLQLKTFDQGKIIDETESLLQQYEKNGLSANDLAKISGLPLLLAQERLLQTEKCAKAVRDDSNEGLRFFPNLFFNPICAN